MGAAKPSVVRGRRWRQNAAHRTEWRAPIVFISMGHRPSLRKFDNRVIEIRSAVDATIIPDRREVDESRG